MTLKVAVSGGNGYIGSSALRQLGRYDVRKISLQRQAQNPIADEVRAYSLSDMQAQPNLVSGIDVVIHTAALVHKRADERAHMDHNFQAAKLLFNLSEKAGVKKFIFLSTVGVYGLHGSDDVLTVDTSPRPKTAYARAKLCAEQYMLNQNSSMEVSVLRLPLVYGAEAPGNYGALVRLAQKPVPLPFSGIRNKRSMVNVETVGEVLAEMCTGEIDACGLHLLAESRPFSTEGLLKKIRRENHMSPMLFPFPRRFMKGVLKILGKDEQYTQLYDNLQFKSTIRL